MVVERDEESAAYAMARTKDYAWQKRNKRGDYPGIDEQGKVYDEYYARHQNIKLAESSINGG